MADDKNFKELVKEIQDLNKSITKQNVERADSLNDLVNAQNKTTEMVTRRLTKAQTAQLEKDNEQIRVAKEESDRQADADKKAQELEDKKFTMKKFNDRVSNKLKKAPSALLGAAKFATYQNRVMRNLGKGVGKLNRGLGIGKALKTGKDTFFGIIKRLIQGGLIIGGIIALDKFFNSEYWPKTIDFIENKLIPGIKDFFNFMKDKFGPMLTKIFVGEGGTLANPTGGIYGAIQGIYDYFSNNIKNLEDEDVGGKFNKTARSFFKLLTSIFDFGSVPLTGDTKGKLSYTEKVKKDFKTFMTNLGTLFDAMARQTVAVLTGYTTDEEKFFVGVRNDLKKMITSMVEGLGMAFADAHPIIGRVLGLKGSKETAFEKIGKKRPELAAKIFTAVKTRGVGYMEDAYERMNPEDREFTKEYIKALDEFEKFKPAGDKNLINNAVVRAILGEGNMTEGQKAAGGMEGIINAVKRLMPGKAPDIFGVDKEKFIENLPDIELTPDREKKFIFNMDKLEQKLEMFEKRGASEKDIKRIEESIDKLIEQYKNMSENTRADLSILNKGGDVYEGDKISNNRMVAFADSNINRFSTVG